MVNDAIVGLRHTLHRCAEFSHREEKTAATIEEFLKGTLPDDNPAIQVGPPGEPVLKPVALCDSEHLIVAAESPFAVPCTHQGLAVGLPHIPGGNTDFPPECGQRHVR